VLPESMQLRGICVILDAGSLGAEVGADPCLGYTPRDGLRLMFGGQYLAVGSLSTVSLTLQGA
jgi:hypothetical protein